MAFIFHVKFHVLYIFIAFINPTWQQRIQMNFDFNWLFSIIPNPQLNCDNSYFPINLNAIKCWGASQQVTTAQTEQDCRNACCGNSMCAVYQYCSNQTCGKPGDCWIGEYYNCGPSKPGWISGARQTPSQTPPFNDKYSNPNYNDSNWKHINIPHDYIVYNTFSPLAEESHGYLPTNISWYRKYFNLDTKWINKSIWLEFDGVYRDSHFYLNGVYLGNHQSGYTAFRFYITNIKPLYFTDNSKQNVLAVRVNPVYNEGWWYEGGGIYRHSKLIVTDNIHIKPWGVYVGNNVTKILNVNGKYGNAMMDIQTNITFNASSSASKIVSLQTDIVSKSNGNVIATQKQTDIKLTSNQEIFISQKLNVQNVRLWSVFHPELHVVISSIIDMNGDIIDSVSTTFGFRKMYFDVDGGFYLNDQYVKIKGFCNHQDFGGCGIALPDRVNRFRMETLKEMGANAWRMSHNPPNKELLDFADEYGILVWDENRHFENNMQYFQDMEDMINRDKNHPSIVIWSLCNEG
eukprot:155103_1